MGSRQPKLILRESCIGEYSKAWMPGSFLEVGAGTGYMTQHFLRLGYHGACYDKGGQCQSLLEANLAAFGDQIRVASRLEELPETGFDYLLAFEVLEHILDDRAVLSAWTRHLKPGGRILLSVPAHAHKYGKSDEIVGHVRRYEKAPLSRLLADIGYEDVRIVNYGFPLTEATRRVSNWLLAGQNAHLDLSPEERSLRSSFTRPPLISSLLNHMGESIFKPFCLLQRLFYSLDWGDGYVATAVKRGPRS